MSRISETFESLGRGGGREQFHPGLNNFEGKNYQNKQARQKRAHPEENSCRKNNWNASDYASSGGKMHKQT